METELTRDDWQNVIDECAKQMELMVKTLKNMMLAAKLQKTTFETAKEELEKLPEVEKEKPKGLN